jgi:hypothetical protein
MKDELRALNWLERMKMKDKTEIDNQKKRIINQIKHLDKSDILPKPTKKLTIWKRIKKVLMGY